MFSLCENPDSTVCRDWITGSSKTGLSSTAADAVGSAIVCVSGWVNDLVYANSRISATKPRASIKIAPAILFFFLRRGRRVERVPVFLFRLLVFIVESFQPNYEQNLSQVLLPATKFAPSDR